jgi:hypothetical protein
VPPDNRFQILRHGSGQPMDRGYGTGLPEIAQRLIPNISDL